MNKMLFVLAAVAAFAVAARAQTGADQSPAPAAAPAAAPADGAAMPDHKGEWKDKLKEACSTEIADGGVCAGKDFGAGLEKCLERHQRKLSDGCRKAVRKHRRHWQHWHHDGDKHGDKPAAAPAAAPDAAPAPAPAQ